MPQQTHFYAVGSEGVREDDCSSNWNLPFIVTYNSKESYCKKDGTNKQK